MNVNVLKTPEYFSHLGDCLATLMVDDILTISSIGTLTNRLIYKHLATFKEPKAVLDNPGVEYARIWKRLYMLVSTAVSEDIEYLLIHNKLPVPERLHRTGFRVDSFCAYCPGAQVSDVVHFFCTCVRTRRCWLWIKRLVGSLCDRSAQSSDWNMLNLAFPKSSYEKEISWLIVSYVNFAWTEFSVRDSALDLDIFFGFLKFKYKENANAIGRIPSLAL